MLMQSRSSAIDASMHGFEQFLALLHERLKPWKRPVFNGLRFSTIGDFKPLLVQSPHFAECPSALASAQSNAHIEAQR
ncbi:hypothetical protein IQ268_18665 [Oculatella sp. LEGE 06141]|uniref:hypothetical protein n=1 Tax=Oculatella sp. LEGE 06141 TaxID=1828648 RepID=UPI00187ED07E|nr:hypothetical protein [Oculatella sp. LEGE 06141]MBE9180588.1 hypothetical protein [Oculatella sp. LEGE 06141]